MASAAPPRRQIRTKRDARAGGGGGGRRGPAPRRRERGLSAPARCCPLWFSLARPASLGVAAAAAAPRSSAFARFSPGTALSLPGRALLARLATLGRQPPPDPFLRVHCRRRAGPAETGQRARSSVTWGFSFPAAEPKHTEYWYKDRSETKVWTQCSSWVPPSSPFLAARRDLAYLFIPFIGSL